MASTQWLQTSYNNALISTSHLPTITKFNGVLLPKFIITLRFNGTILQTQSIRYSITHI